MIAFEYSYQTHTQTKNGRSTQTHSFSTSSATPRTGSAARRFYNGNVRDYNTRVQSFPSNLIASAPTSRRRLETRSLDRPAQVDSSKSRTGDLDKLDQR